MNNKDFDVVWIECETGGCKVVAWVMAAAAGFVAVVGVLAYLG